jgi:hypothetical protein
MLCIIQRSCRDNILGNRVQLSRMTIVLLQEVGCIRHASSLDILTLDRDLSLSFAIALIDAARALDRTSCIHES